MNSFRVTITLHSGLSFVREIEANSTAEAMEKAHDKYWPAYRGLFAMPAPTIH